MARFQGLRRKGLGLGCGVPVMGLVGAVFAQPQDARRAHGAAGGDRRGHRSEGGWADRLEAS